MVKELFLTYYQHAYAWKYRKPEMAKFLQKDHVQPVALSQIIVIVR